MILNCDFYIVITTRYIFLKLGFGEMYVMYGNNWYSPSNVCAICDIKLLLQLVGWHLIL